jgi:hypothetical protein
VRYLRHRCILEGIQRPTSSGTVLLYKSRIVPRILGPCSLPGLASPVNFHLDELELLRCGDQGEDQVFCGLLA